MSSPHTDPALPADRRLWPQETTGHANPLAEPFEKIAARIEERLREGLFKPLARRGWQADGLVASPGAIMGVPLLAVRVLAPNRVAHVTQTIQTAHEVAPQAAAVLMVELKHEQEMIAVMAGEDPLVLLAGFLREYVRRPQLPEGKKALGRNLLELLPA